MARTVRDANLETRAARLRLKPRHEPYWRALEPGRHLGYRKGPLGGMWKARMLLEDGNYAKDTIGRADDVLDSDGVKIFSYREAQEKARAWFARRARIAAGMEPEQVGPYTVADAMRDYLAHLASRGARGLAQTQQAAKAHVLPALGEKQVAHLTTQRIREWHHAIAAEAPRVRTRKGKAQKRRALQSDTEARRKRQATANRVLTILKAALNHTWREGKAASDAAWRKVKPFRDVDAPVIRYLSEAECVRLVNATAPEFRPLVRAALLTGCRYGEITALKAADFSPDAGTVFVRTSKSGKPRHVYLTDEGKAFFADTVAGKSGSDLIFRRPDDKPWGKSHQQRPLLDACKRAKIAPAISFHVLRHSHGTLLAMRGVPMPVIAKQLGHADTRMTERHYAHLAPSYVSEAIRANFPKLGIVEQSNIVHVQAKL